MKTQPKPKSGRPSGDHAKRQRDIADTLLQVIGEHGFEKASMRMVARAAGCTTGVLSHYFSSKEDLICHAVDLLFDRADQRAILATKSGDSLEALRVAVGEADLKPPSYDFWAVWLQVLARAKQNRRLTQIVNKRHGRFRELLTRIIEDGQRKGQIRSDIAADLLADHFNAVTDGVGLMAPIEAKRLTSERINALMRVSVALIRAV